jgi:hypothetical protein
MGENRFLERVMAMEEFRRIYGAHLEDFLARLCMCRIGCTGASMKSPPSFALPSRLNPRFAWRTLGDGSTV